MKTTFAAFPDLNECIVEWKILFSSLIFSKENCFDLYNLFIKSDSWGYFNSISVNKSDEQCFSKYFDVWQTYINTKNLIQYDYKKYNNNNFYFKINETFDAKVSNNNMKLAFSQKIWDDQNFLVPINSLVTWIYKEKPNLDIWFCYTQKVSEEKVINENIFENNFFIFWIFIWIIFWIVFFKIYLFFKKS